VASFGAGGYAGGVQLDDTQLVYVLLVGLGAFVLYVGLLIRGAIRSRTPDSHDRN
jgi:hypothetical protein